MANWHIYWNLPSGISQILLMQYAVERLHKKGKVKAETGMRGYVTKRK